MHQPLGYTFGKLLRKPRFILLSLKPLTQGPPHLWFVNNQFHGNYYYLLKDLWRQFMSHIFKYQLDLDILQFCAKIKTRQLPLYRTGTFYMATGNAWWLTDCDVDLFSLKSSLKKTSIFQVFLFWAASVKYQRWVLFCLVPDSPTLLYLFCQTSKILEVTWVHEFPFCPHWKHTSSDFIEKLQIETRRDVDGVHGQRGWVKWKQNRKHVFGVQQQQLRVIPLL